MYEQLFVRTLFIFACKMLFFAFLLYVIIVLWYVFVLDVSIMAEKKFFGIVSDDPKSLESLQARCAEMTNTTEIGIGYAGVDTYFLIAREDIQRIDDNLFGISGTSGYFYNTDNLDSLFDDFGVVGEVRVEGMFDTYSIGTIGTTDDKSMRDVAMNLAKNQERDYMSVSEAYNEETGQYESNRRADWYFKESERLGIEPDICKINADVELVGNVGDGMFCDERIARLPLVTKYGSLLDVEVMLPSSSYFCPEPFVGEHANDERPTANFKFASGPDTEVVLFGDENYKVRWDTTGRFNQGLMDVRGSDIAERAEKAQELIAQREQRDIEPVGNVRVRVNANGPKSEFDPYFDV